jgi:hypothetical protein
VLSSDAKSVLIPILIVGAIATSLGAVRPYIGGDPGKAALGRLEAAPTVFKRSVSRCPARPDRFRCYEQAEGTWSAAWERYSSDIADGYPYASRKSRAVAAIGASTAVALALFDSSRAKTESAHLVAYEKVQKLIGRFETVLRSSRYDSP